MKTLVFSLLALSSTAISGMPPWISQTSGVAMDLNAIHCINAVNCYAVGDSGLNLITTDGKSWRKGGACYSIPDSCSAPGARPCESKDTVRIYPKLRAVQFATMEYGFSVGDSGVILRTTDGGKAWKKFNWSAANSGLANIGLRAISCPSAQDCWVVGEYGYSLRTTDGGLSWKGVSSVVDGDGNDLRTSLDYTFKSISCTDSGTCFVAGISTSAASRSSVFRNMKTKQAWTWTASLLGSTAASNQSVCFLDKKIGYTVGYDVLGSPATYSGHVSKTTDGGATWKNVQSTTIESRFPSYITCRDTAACYLISTDPRGSVAANSFVESTLDGGSTWNSDSIAGVSAINCPETGTCYAVGFGGKIWKQSTPPSSLKIGRSNVDRRSKPKRSNINVLGRTLAPSQRLLRAFTID